MEGNVKELADKLKANLSSVIVGKEKNTDLVLTALIAGGHILIEDTPGTGKTLMAKSLRHLLMLILRGFSLHLIFCRQI